MADSQLVQFEVSDGVALLTMDDGKANALSAAMLTELDAALVRATTDAKALVIAGREGRFCGGFDLKVMMSGPANARALVSQGAELLMRLYELPLPVVAACTGHAVAAGALLLCACDHRIGAAGEFKIGLNEVAIGMTVPLLAQELARDRLAPTRLTEAVIQAVLYPPEEAMAVGYLDRVEAPGAVVAAAVAHAAALAKHPRGAYSATKARLRRATIDHVRETLQADMDTLTGITR